MNSNDSDDELLCAVPLLLLYTPATVSPLAYHFIPSQYLWTFPFYPFFEPT